MIKLKDILLESTAPNIFVPRRMKDRVERMIMLYVKNGSKGDLDLSDMNLTVLPDILKDISVDGDFFCGTNNLTSLENCPKTVGGNFFCGHNKLTSLQGAPSSVGGSFYCSFNYLTSLTGAPKFVGGAFSCGFNEIKFTEEQVRAVCNVKGDIYGVL
jgi:hypothetical protein